MKILTFTTLFPSHKKPDFGIFIKNRMQTVNGLEGAEVKVVAPIPWFPPVKFFNKWYTFSQIPRYEVIDDIEVYHPRYLVTPKVGMSLYWLWMFLGSIGTIRRIQRSFDFDLIDAHYIYPDGLAAIWLSRLTGRPVVLSARGTDINLYAGLPLIKQLVKIALRKADHLIAVSRSLADLMVEAGADNTRISVIPNGIDPTRFFPGNQRTSREKVGLPIDKKILLTVCGLNERKGVHLLVEALFQLRQADKLDFITMVVGSGEMEQMLAQKIISLEMQDQVTLAGQVSHEDLPDYYRAADVFFLGSSREGWPNVVCEAQACGIPVVATPVNGTPEILDSTKLGLLVERNSQAFAAGIKQAFETPWDNCFIATKGQQRTWSKVAQEVFYLFRAVLDNSNGSQSNPH